MASDDNTNILPWKKIVYNNCQAEDLIDGEKIELILMAKLSAIIGIVEKETGLYEIFENFCSAMKIGSSGLLDQRCKQGVINNRDEIPQKIKSILPIHDEDIKIDSSKMEPGNIVFEFSLIKVSKQNDSLLLIPCYLCIRFRNDLKFNGEFTLEYREQTFSLYKKQNQLSETLTTNNQLIYENCNSNSQICEKSINSILDYAFKAMGVDMSLFDADQSYKDYCNRLGNRLGSSEPYFSMKEVNKVEEHLIAQNLLQMLPQGRTVGQLINSVANVLCVNTTRTETDLANPDLIKQITVIRIKLEGENIEIIPSYFKIESFRQIDRGYIWNSSTSKYSIEYKQQKFILSKFDIEQIIKKMEITD